MPRPTVTTTFIAVCLLLGILTGRDLRDRDVHVMPEFPPKPADPLDLAYMDAVVQAGLSFGETYRMPWRWIVAGAVGVALVYALSILLHELGHYFAARAVKADVEGITLHAAGGFVELADDGRLTNRRFALIVAAGPLVTALLAGAAYLATPEAFAESPAGIVAERLLTIALHVNAFALVVNLLPLRGLDGWHLLRSAPRRRARGGAHAP